jgi:prepilin-type N-terminal cleavage/methylation domain-containing protein
MKSFQEEKQAPEGKDRRNVGFTLIELLVVMGLLSLIVFLIYPAYLGSSRSYSLSDVKSSLQQNARLGMKRMVTYLEAGMVVIPEESDEATDGGENNYGYDKGNPHKIVFYTWNTSPNEKIALYAASSALDIDPIDPTEEENPLLYMRRYASLSWEDPVPLIRPEVRVTQLNFILGGDNEDKVLVTLELAQKGPTADEWRTYKLVSAVKMGAR